MPYPVNNRRTRLTIDFFHIRRQVGEYLQIDKGTELWDTEQDETIKDVIKDGLQLYYYPPMLEPPFTDKMGDVHEWTFLRPTWRFSTAAGEKYYMLPEDWERAIGPMNLLGSDTTITGPILQISPAKIRNALNASTIEGTPVYYAVDPLETQGDEEQTYRIHLFPTPDRVYECEQQYQTLGQMIDADHPFPLGGQTNGPGILAACLAVAEFRMTGEEGAMHQKFMRLLAANIVRDRAKGSKNLGYNGNGLQIQPFSRRQRRAQDLIYIAPTLQSWV